MNHSLGNSMFCHENTQGSGFPGFCYGLLGSGSDMEQKFKLAVGQGHGFVERDAEW